MFTSAKNVSLLLLSISAFSMFSAQAEDVPLRGPISFEAFDKDDNKMISPQEFVDTHNLRNKQRTDAGMPANPNPRSFTFFDTNGDSQISADELNMNRGSRGGMQRQGMGPGMKQGMRPGMRQGMGPGMRQGMNRGRQMPVFSDFDLNNDGIVQQEEFLKAREARMRKRAEEGRMMRNAANAPGFASIDTNKDGKVSQEEFAAHQAKHRKMMGMPR